MHLPILHQNNYAAWESISMGPVSKPWAHKIPQINVTLASNAGQSSSGKDFFCSVISLSPPKMISIRYSAW